MILGHHVTKRFKLALLDVAKSHEPIFTKCGRCGKAILCMYIQDGNHLRYYTDEVEDGDIP